MKNEGILKKIADFIGKDIKAQNESKKLIVVIRELILSIAFYCAVNGVLSGITHGLGEALLFLSFLAVCIFEFVMSYRCRSMITLWMFNIGAIAWILIMVHLFGWNIGVQHFLIVLLILYFFSSYKHYGEKVFYAVALCAIRLLLFYNYQNRIPDWKLPALEEDFLQVMNTMTIFWCISVVAFVFSNDAQELEGKLVEDNNQLKEQANTDTLTGLWNRRKALEVMENICKNQVNQMGFCLSICDIDFFKKVNDNYGHDVGDEVLREVGKILKQEMQGKNFVGRWGGEEFMLVFPECNGDVAYVKLEEIRKKIKDMKIQKNDLTFGITMTFGLAEYDFMNGLNATIKEADEKLYMGKEKGRDIIVF